jgi:hypothetical protein
MESASMSKAGGTIGKTEAWVTDRTGHQSSQMLYRYKRKQRLWTVESMTWMSRRDWCKLAMLA